MIFDWSSIKLATQQDREKTGFNLVKTAKV